MAAGDITVTTLDELLKRVYAPWEIEQLTNLEAPVVNECAAKGSAALGGSGFYFAVRMESAEGQGFILEDGNLPTGGQTIVKQPTTTPKVQAGVVQLTGLSVAVSSGDAMSFARAFDENVQHTILSMTAYKEGALFRDGTGKLAVFTAAPGADTGPHTLDDVSHLREGMKIAIVDATDGTSWIHGSGAGATAAVVTVDEIDWVNRQVKWKTSLHTDVDVNDELYLSGVQDEADGTAPSVREPEGFEASILDTNTYLGLDRTAAGNSNWKGLVQTVSGFLNEDEILQARSRITQEAGIFLSGMANRFKLVMHPTQADVLFKLAIPRIRYEAGGAFDLGNRTEVSFGGIPIRCSHLAPDDVAYMGDFSVSKTLYTPNGELHVDTEYNGSALKWVPTRDVGLAFLKSYYTFAVTRPNCLIALRSLTQASRT